MNDAKEHTQQGLIAESDRRSYTPPPWHNDGYRIYAPTDSDDKRDGRVIVEYKHVHDFNWDDAPLITAAPELLEACQRIVDIADDDHPDAFVLEISRADVEALRGVIAKATPRRCTSNK